MNKTSKKNDCKHTSLPDPKVISNEELESYSYEEIKIIEQYELYQQEQELMRMETPH